MKKFIKILTFLIATIFLFSSAICFAGCGEKDNVEQVIEVQLYKFNGMYTSKVKEFIFTKENYTETYEVEYDGSIYSFKAIARYNTGMLIAETVASSILYLTLEGYNIERQEIRDVGWYSIKFSFFTGDFIAYLDFFVLENK